MTDILAGASWEVPPNAVLLGAVIAAAAVTLYCVGTFSLGFDMHVVTHGVFIATGVAGLALAGVTTTLGRQPPPEVALALATGPFLLAFAGLLALAYLAARPVPPPTPVGTCRRCGHDLYDPVGNHRYTDHTNGFLCPPQFRQPGHRLHQLALAPAPGGTP